MKRSGNNVWTLLLLLVVMATLDPKIASAKRTCFMDIALATNYAHYVRDFPNFKVRGWFCRAAKVKCPAGVVNHMKSKLGGEVAPLRGKAVERVCNIFRREVLPSHKGAVYAKWKASNCGRTGSVYLGRLCCWRYTFGSQTIFIGNDLCKQTTKPSASRVLELMQSSHKVMVNESEVF